MEGLPEQLRELRRIKSWTQEDVAHKLGVSLSTVQRWEKKGSKRPFKLARRQLVKLLRKAKNEDKGSQT